MTVKIENNNLVITIPVNSPLRTSATGKTKLVASTNGNIVTSAVVEGKNVTLGLNAYIKNDAYVKPAV